MEGWILLNQRHFILEEPVSFTVDGIRYIHSDTEVEINSRIEGSGIWELLGLVFKYSLINRPYFIKKDSFENMSEIVYKADVALLMYDYIFRCLWFVKDCSCNTDQVGVCLVDGSQAIIRSKSGMYSTARGEFKDEKFTLQEIAQCFKLRDSYDDLSTKKAKILYKPEIDPIEILAGEGSLKPYNDINRIERAFQFLSDARSTSLLPAKISFYVLILECLFSANDSNEIQHKISERVAFYMGESARHRVELFKDIKVYYAIRSKYVHGQRLDNKFRDNKAIAEHSEKLDSLIRSILIRIITVDSSIFLLNDKELTEWFQSLVFK